MANRRNYLNYWPAVVLLTCLVLATVGSSAFAQGEIGPKFEQVPRQIAYIEYDQRTGESNGIWLTDVRTLETQQITNDPTDCCLAWSPDGNLLYFVRDPKPKEQLYTPSRGAIMVYDFRTGQERRIDTPALNLAATLAVSRDGQMIAFGTRDYFHDEGSYTGCLYVMDLDTSESRLIDCRKPGAIYDMSFSPADDVLAVEVGYIEGSGIEFYKLSDSTILRDDQISGINPKYIPDGEGFLAGPTGYGVSSIRYYETFTSAPVTLVEEPWGEMLDDVWQESGRFVGAPDVSPDSRYLVYNHNGMFEIMDLQTRHTFALVNFGFIGYSITWRPDSDANGPVLGSLLERKRKAIEVLRTTRYETSGGVILPGPTDALDESAADALVASLAADPAGVAPEQAIAFERLVMQEETLVTLLEDYSALSSDLGDAEADIALMLIGTGFLTAEAGIGGSGAIIDLLKKTVQDFFKLCLYAIKDATIRATMREFVDGLPLLIDVTTEDVGGLSEEFLERASSDYVRRRATVDHIAEFVSVVQPTVDQGVRTVSGKGEPVWSVEGSAEAAQINMNSLVSQSGMMRDLAQNIYGDSLARGREVNEFLKDIVDLVLLGTKNPIVLIYNLQTRLQQILIDLTGMSVVANAMTCTRDAAVLSGELAFRANQPPAQCQTPIPVDLVDFFRRLLSEGEGAHQLVRVSMPSQTTASDFDETLSDYRAAVMALHDALNTGDDSAVRARADKLAIVSQVFNEEAALTMARLGPTAEGRDTEGEIALGTAITFTRLDAAFILAAADSWSTAADPDDTVAFKQILQKAEANVDLLARVRSQVPLPSAMTEALPVVDVPTEISAVVGQTTTIPVLVTNAGGQPLYGAQLTLEVDGVAADEVALPDLSPGKSASLPLTYVPSADGRILARVWSTGGDRDDYRTFTIVAGMPGAVSVDPVTLPGPNVSAEPDALAQDGGTSFIQIILIGIMVVSGTVFALGLGVLLVRNMRR